MDQNQTAEHRAPLNPRLPRLWHGADYFPEQWLEHPEVLEEDLRLMKAAGCNVTSVGMFAWSALEPEEGRFRFEWLDHCLERIAAEGLFAILATPSGGRPAWLSQNHPEVPRVDAGRRRNLHGLRHNHCYTSPVYREKAAAMARRLAERYRAHPALLMWHVSNEYGGECHCELCQAAFRNWLQHKYASLEELNRRWWNSFWSHAYSDWEQIQSPAPHGEPLLPALSLDWKRFVTDQTVAFLLAESAPLRELTPGIPITTNMMGTYAGLNYWKFAPHLDAASWTSYPAWHGSGEVFDHGFPWDPLGRDWRTAAATAFGHDLMRSLKAGRPFMLMESTPTFSNWQAVWKLKKPGMHALSSLLAVAHGSDTVQFFQWRQSRGGVEKFHGAAVNHAGGGETRVFKEIAELGRVLARLDGVAGTRVAAQVALLFDWENRWALEAAGVRPASGQSSYEASCKRHHYPFWAMGIPVDVIDTEQDFSGYRLVVAPLLYMLKPGVAGRLEGFVREGGTLVTTCWSGIVDENDLCFLGPGPLRALLGILPEEVDGLYPGEANRLLPHPGNALGLRGSYAVGSCCGLVRAESARVLAVYGRDFYTGRAALTANAFGAGRAYYLAAEAEDRFFLDFYRGLTRRLGIRAATGRRLPEGVTAQRRSAGSQEYLFLLNFAPRPRIVRLDRRDWIDALDGTRVPRRLTLPPLGWRVCRGGRAAP